MGRLNLSDYLKGDPSVDRWLRFKQPLTQKLYSRTLRAFIDDFTAPQFGVKDPSSLVSRAKSRRDNLEVQDVIEKFAESQPLSSQSVRMATIRSFLKRNGVVLPSVGNWQTHQKSFHRGYKHEEIESLLGFLDSYLQKLYVLVCKDSGLRAADVLSLCYRHVRKDIETGREYVHLDLEPWYYQRRKASGITFLGPNSVQLLKQLIHEKRIKPIPEAKIFPFSYPTIAQSLLIAKRKAGLDKEIQISHGLRKFFEQALDKAGMDHHKKLQIEGHSQGVRIHYTDRNVDELRRLYQNAYQYLDLSEEASQGRIVELEKVLVEQRQRIETLQAEAKNLPTWNQIEDIRRENREIKQTMFKLGKNVAFYMPMEEEKAVQIENLGRGKNLEQLIREAVRDYIRKNVHKK